MGRPLLNVRLNSDAWVCCRQGARTLRYYSTPGTVEILPSGLDANWTASDGGFDYLTLSFVAEQMPRSAETQPPTEYEVLDADPLVRELSVAMVESMLAGPPTANAEILGPMALTLLHRVKSRRDARTATRAACPKPACGAPLRRLIDRLPGRCGDNLTVAALAREIGVSVTTFNTQFKLATGSSPHQFLTRLRLEQVCASLRDSNEAIASIALSAGFSSQSHLTAVFHRMSGVTPQQYRAANLPRNLAADARHGGRADSQI